ncbi:MAG: type I DNA topoisomerase [Acidobacteria bacterium]|nr:MAG: type I DNA topoisomerase [Acidobacteriota bacterium]
MAKSLVIVESPAKARTINKFLGKDFRVKASMGHVRDLPKNPKKKGDPDWIGVDEDHGFRAHYVLLPEKKKTVEELIAAAKGAREILLAADPDREGEAICWHLKEILSRKVDAPIRRILFNEITRRAVRAALDNPRDIDMDKVDAQQARRILDRIVGYRVSPLLWEKVRRGLSAGRVQTVALRMIAEREAEIERFVPVEYWTVEAEVEPPDRPRFPAKLVSWRGEPVPWKGKGEEKKPALPDEAAAREVLAHVSGKPFEVAAVEAKRSRRSSPPPFTTSKLQQEASRRLRLSVSQTMRLAQGLYEGKDLGELGTVGLITYMRTDSVRVSAEAIEAVRAHIARAYGEEYLPKSPRVFRQRKNAQDAHEAIRPTSLELTPERVAKYLKRDELRLYTLIWNRFVASQMAPAVFDVTKVRIAAGDAVFEATGQVMRFPGWQAVYREEPAEEEGAAEGKLPEGSLPEVREGERLTVIAVEPRQNFTQPPPRYSEAMLVRALEENGIGRPSTYAAILSVLTDRDYVEKVDGRFRPTPLGRLVTELLVENFGDIFEIPYTARMEAILDEIEEGRRTGEDALREFVKRFRKDLEKARRTMRNVKQDVERTDITCDACGATMVKRWGRFGEFLACERYPECKNTKDLGENSEPLPKIEASCPACGREMVVRRGRWGLFLACSGYPECKTTQKIELTEEGTLEIQKDEILDETCPRCGKPLARKSGRYGRYIACSAYPKCRYTKQQEVGVDCPSCGKPLVARRSRKGRLFYGCSGYPDCSFVSWKKPVPDPCPKCGAPYRLESVTKRSGRQLICDNKDCGHREKVSEEQPAGVT